MVNWNEQKQAGRVSYADQVQQGLVRRNGPAFVAAEPRQPPAVIDAPAWMVERQPMAVDAVWTPVEGAQDRTSAMDRARALQVRLLPFLAVWGLIAVVVGVVVGVVVVDVAVDVAVAGVVVGIVVEYGVVCAWM